MKWKVNFKDPDIEVSSTCCKWFLFICKINKQTVYISILFIHYSFLNIQICIQLTDSHVTVGIPLTRCVNDVFKSIFIRMSCVCSDTVLFISLCPACMYYIILDRIPLSKRQYVKFHGLRGPVTWILTSLLNIQVLCKSISQF